MEQRQAEFAKKDAAKEAKRLADELIATGMSQLLHVFNVFDDVATPTATATL